MDFSEVYSNSRTKECLCHYLIPEDTVKVITVSGTYGSGGTEFSRRLAERLGYQYADQALIKDVENDPRECSTLLTSIEEEVAPGFLNKVAGLMNNHSFFKTTLAACIFEQVINSDLVIAGSSPHLFLAGCPSLISVHVIRKLSERVRSVAERKRIKAEEAHRIIESVDRERSEFVRYYFDKELYDPLMFHLAINTSMVPVEEALDLMVAYSKDFSARLDAARTEQFLKDRLLEKKADLVLFHLGLTHGAKIEFEADRGNITVRGVVGGAHEKERLFETLGKMGETTELIDRVKVEILSRNIY
jgi:CMP/dCMP kinase